MFTETQRKSLTAYKLQCEVDARVFAPDNVFEYEVVAHCGYCGHFGKVRKTEDAKVCKNCDIQHAISVLQDVAGNLGDCSPSRQEEEADKLDKARKLLQKVLKS